MWPALLSGFFDKQPLDLLMAGPGARNTPPLHP
jgi:hypothetical protein